MVTLFRNYIHRHKFVNTAVVLFVIRNLLADHSLKAYLEEQHEWDPLVVGVVPSFIFTLYISPYCRVGYVGSYGLALLMW
jgi:hypothetical protein